MKELIDKLARGTIEYELPVLEVSVSEIDKTLYSEKISEESFEVYSSNDVELKGMVYSTHEFVNINDEDRKVAITLDGEEIEDSLKIFVSRKYSITSKKDSDGYINKVVIETE